MIALGFGWAPAVLTVAVDGLLASLRQRPRRLDRILFNVAEPALSMAACALVLDAVSGLSPAERLGAPLSHLLVPGFAATTAYLLLNSALTAVAVALEARTSAVAAWRTHVNLLVLDYFGGTSLAVLVVASANDLGFWEVVAALPLLAALHWTYRSTMRRTAEALEYSERLKRLYMATVETLAMAIDAKDQVTHGHIRRVQIAARRRPGEVRSRCSDDSTLQALEAGALLHDIGQDRGARTHPQQAGEADAGRVRADQAPRDDRRGDPRAVDFPYPVVPIVRHHHENWDGTGLPRRPARATAIPIGARILSVVDCYDALTSDRPYRRAMTHDEALAIVGRDAGRCTTRRSSTCSWEWGSTVLRECLRASSSSTPRPVSMELTRPPGVTSHQDAAPAPGALDDLETLAS